MTCFTPQAAFYAFPKLEISRSDQEFVAELDPRNRRDRSPRNRALAKGRARSTFAWSFFRPRIPSGKLSVESATLPSSGTERSLSRGAPRLRPPAVQPGFPRLAETMCV